MAEAFQQQQLASRYSSNQHPHHYQQAAVVTK